MNNITELKQRILDAVNNCNTNELATKSSVTATLIKQLKLHNEYIGQLTLHDAGNIISAYDEILEENECNNIN